MPYVFSHASLIRLPVSLLCYCDLYLSYKHLHCSKKKKKKKKSQCVTVIDVEKNNNSEIVDFFLFIFKYLSYLNPLIAVCLQPSVLNGYSEELRSE